MNVFVVHAHPEPRSFSSALVQTTSATLAAAGHTVTVSDLYATRFNPVSGRQNFVTVRNPDYYKQQQEELYASENDGFASDIESEIRKLEAADLLVFSFPMWWFGMPGILKGWVDRVSRWDACTVTVDSMRMASALPGKRER
jgi:NAD(P)H dehydrogenase (quinone)